MNGIARGVLMATEQYWEARNVSVSAAVTEVAVRE